MTIRPWDFVRFDGYEDEIVGDFQIGEWLLVEEVEPDGAIYARPLTLDRARDLVWPGEVTFVPAVPISVDERVSPQNAS